MDELRKKVPPKYRTSAHVSKALSTLAAELDLEINDLFTLDFNTIQFDTLIHWCSHYTTRWLYAEALLTRDNHYTRLEELRNEKERVEKREPKIKKIYESLPKSVKVNGSLRAIRELYDNTNALKDLETLSQDEIMDIIETIKENSYLNAILLKKCAVVIMTMKKVDTNRMDDLYKARFDTTITDKYRMKNDWSKRIVDLAENSHRTRLSKTSSCVEDTLKTHLSHEIRILMLFENYVLEEHEKSLEEFLAECEIDDIVDMICDTSSDIKVANERVKSQHTKHHATQFVNNALSILRVIPNVRNEDQLKSIKPSEILSEIQDLREVPEGEIRRHFTYNEIHRIFDSTKDDPQFTLILRILKEVGLRINAIVSLKVRQVLHEYGRAKDKSSVLDKGKKVRHILFGEQLQNDILQYVETLGDRSPGSFLFPQVTNPKKHATPNSVRKKLISTATKCGIHGVHVHPHAFRHTLVNNLIEQGNDIHKVSKFLGHTSTSTTETYYWTSKVSDIVATMNVPWLGQYNVKIEMNEESEEEEKMRNQMITDILIVCISMMTYKQRVELKSKVPDIDEIINHLQEYSSICSSSTMGSNEGMTYQNFI